MSAPVITQIPTPPLRSNAPADFAVKADAFAASLPQLVTQTNTSVAFVDQQAVAAAADAASAASSATGAANSSTKAGQWADSGEDVAVETGKYSAKHHAIKADASAASILDAVTTTTNSATNATASASAAAASATNAGNSAQAAADSAASIADGPVASINGQSGIVVLGAGDVGAQPASVNLGGFATKTAPAGAVVGTTDTQTLTNKTLTSPAIDRYTLTTATTTTLNLAASQVFRIPYAASRTLTFSNVPAASAAMVVVVKLMGAGTVTWPTINWNEATAPELGATWTEVVLFWDGAAWSGAMRAFE